MQGGVVRGSFISKFRPPDVELGKRDDDGQSKKDDDHQFKPARRGFSLRWRRKRVLVVLLGIVVLSVVMHYTGSSTGEKKSVHANPFAYRPPPRDPAHDAPRWNEIREPTGAPPGMRAPSRGEPTPHAFAGAFKFYRLARSLRGAAHTDGYRRANRNVLFAASSLQSAATLIPLACEMGRRDRNWVHLALLGRADIPLDDVLALNGVDGEACPVLWHDARPDYSEWSTDERAEASVQSALTHMQSFLHPQVAIVDAAEPDAFFTAAVRNRTDAFGLARIEVPPGKSDDVAWMTRLDARALADWHTPTVDVLVHVPPDSSSVLHLLASLQRADYAGLGCPRLTLDLPASLDASVSRALETFAWPPTSSSHSASQLVLRRRIARPATQDSAAIAFLESFYPATPDAHVLVLDPAVQLAPVYFHYVKYALLAHRYAATRDDAVMGVSLELPALLVDGITPLKPPQTVDVQSGPSQGVHGGVPFAMQAPNPHASLFFGDMWAEWHDFLGRRVSPNKGKTKGVTRAKLVSETLPSWTEYMLEFMRARGGFVLYPATTSKEKLASVHTALANPPEEFATESSPEDPFLRAPPSSSHPKISEPPLLGRDPIHHSLPQDADLPTLQNLPQLLYNGHKVDPSSVAVIAAKYRKEFMLDVGGCVVPEGKRRRIVPGSAADMFCFGDEGPEEWEDDGSSIAGRGRTGGPATAEGAGGHV